MRSFAVSGACLAFVGTVSAICSKTCHSYGVDIRQGGSYFIDINSTDPFTATEGFRGGCRDVDANNILVDPSGTQYNCSTILMHPKNTARNITCDIDQDQMVTGDWSILVISNNGKCAPIAYERDFYLTVGPQATAYLFPKVTITSSSTPLSTTLVSTTSEVTAFASAVTVTVPSLTVYPTVTVDLPPVVAHVTAPAAEVIVAEIVPDVVATTTSWRELTCSLPSASFIPDPTAPAYLDLTERSLGLSSGSLAHRHAQAQQRRNVLDGSDEAKAAFVSERRERMALQKRGPDQRTVTVAGTGSTSTVTVTATASTTSTITESTVAVVTVTTSSTVTVTSGVETDVATVTAPRFTATITQVFGVVENTVWQTQYITATVTSLLTPEPAAASCSASGGRMI